MKKKFVVLQVLVAVLLICTSVYGALNTTIDLTQSSKTVKQGDKVTVTLSLKDVDSSKRITSVSGYINYNKNVLDNITVNNIQKNSNGKVNIGNEELAVEDLTNATIDNMPSTVAYVGFNGNPTSNNDVRLVIDFNNGITSDVDLLKIDFNVKSNATIGEIKNAISYSMFVISSDSEQSAEITKNIDLTVQSSNNGNNDQEPDNNKTLSNITITKNPTKTEYKSGERFDKSGMEVTANYSDGTSKVVTNYTYAPNGTLATSDKKITISYTENSVTKTVDQSITVNSSNDDNDNTKKLSNITVTKNPTKTEYKSGEKFDKSGMEITANYSDGTSKVITNYTYTPNGTLSTSDKKITISYTENGVTKTIEQKINVSGSVNNNNSNTNTNTNTNTNANNNTNKNTNTSSNNSNRTDNTIASSASLPKTGAKLLLLPLVAVIALAYFNYRKYKKYKNI